MSEQKQLSESTFRLLAGEVQVWYSSQPSENCPYPEINQVGVVPSAYPVSFPYEELVQTLSEDEKVRLSRFHSQEAGRHFGYSRGLLRRLLGIYLDISPEAVQFCYGASGKPFLLPASNPKKLCFNLSHSNHLIVLAFAYEREIGLDIEFINPEVKMETLVERFFSEQEKTLFRALPEEKRLKAFFKGWTRKEAYLKARGDGLTFPLSRFDVSLGNEPSLLEVRGEPEELSRWKIYNLNVDPAYMATLVIANPLSP